MSCKVEIIAPDVRKTLFCERGRDLRGLLADAGIYIDAPCGGNGKCGKCIVGVSGEVSPADGEELRLMAGREGRLACMCRVLGDCTVTAGRGERDMAAQTDGESVRFPLTPGTGLGAAIDIGTTTVVVYIYELESGRRLSARGGINLQRSFGADVVSRIGSCVEQGPERLVESIRAQIKDMLGGLRVSRAAVAGNTTMEHLFAGLDPSGMAALPFRPESLFGRDFSGDFSDIGMENVFLLPAVSPFVGGDITGAALAAGFETDGEARLLVDIGTNGEMVLSAGGRLVCCATAAGPAFEGAGIACGMGGTDGAVSGVELTSSGPRLTVIGGGEARGICGSGLIDALAVMLALGAVDETGRLLPPDEAPESALPWIHEDGDGVSFRLTESVYITERDVRNLQLAKAAVCGGMLTLLDEAGLTPDTLSSLCIAGGFGSKINRESAAAIGLYPPELAGRCRAIGNAAGMGAAAVLLSGEAKTACLKLADRMEYIDLSSDRRFTGHYVDCMMF